MSVFPVQLRCKGGFGLFTGGISTPTIHAIVPSIEKPETNSIVYTTLFESGFEVEGKAEELCALWWSYLEDEKDEEEEDA